MPTEISVLEMCAIIISRGLKSNGTETYAKDFFTLHKDFLPLVLSHS